MSSAMMKIMFGFDLVASLSEGPEHPNSNRVNTAVTMIWIRFNVPRDFIRLIVVSKGNNLRLLTFWFQEVGELGFNLFCQRRHAVFFSLVFCQTNGRPGLSSNTIQKVSSCQGYQYLGVLLVTVQITCIFSCSLCQRIA
jgi:hypothetical protein